MLQTCECECANLTKMGSSILVASMVAYYISTVPPPRFLIHFMLHVFYIESFVIEAASEWLLPSNLIKAFNPNSRPGLSRGPGVLWPPSWVRIISALA